MSTFKILGPLALAGVLFMFCAGCGGGGSGSSTAIGSSTTLIPELNNYTWNYKLSGTVTPAAGGGGSQTVTGTATATVTTTNFAGEPAFEIDLASNISLDGGAAIPTSLIYYVTQDANGNLIELGQSQTDSSGTTTQTVSSPSLTDSELFPGTYSAGETVGETINFTSSSEAYLLEVIGSTQVTVPAATFSTWQESIAVNNAPFATEDWVPSLGFFVYANFVNQEQLGSTLYNLNINYALTSTSVPGA